MPDSCACRRVLEKLLPYITRVDHFHLSEHPRELLYASEVYAALATPCPCQPPKPSAEDVRHPEAFCQRCRRPNVVWFAPSEIWNRVDTPEGILCPVCFVQSAEAAGIENTGWLLSPETWPASPQSSAGPSGDELDDVQAGGAKPCP